MLVCRLRYWFWDTAVLVQTLAVTASLVLATSLDAFYQLTIMLMIMVIGVTLLAHVQPFAPAVSQRVQVPPYSDPTAASPHACHGAVQMCGSEG